jgi:hypothetical protein
LIKAGDRYAGVLNLGFIIAASKLGRLVLFFDGRALENAPERAGIKFTM